MTSQRLLSQLAAIPVRELRGVGGAKESNLAKLDIHTVFDLITHYPRRYVDRTNQAAIESLEDGVEAMIFARVIRSSQRRTRTGKSLVEVRVSDDAGELDVIFFNQPYRSRQLSEGTQAVFFGKAEDKGKRFQMTNPVVDLVGDRTGKIIPIYPQSEKAGVYTWELARYVDEALDRAGELVDPLDDTVRRDLGLIDRTAAFRNIHQPEHFGAKTQARDRLAFDELLRVQLHLQQRKRELAATENGIEHRIGGPLVSKFTKQLPFALTNAQKRALASIQADLAEPHPMNRLLQGDVGSGKTIVAVLSLLTAVDGGMQGAFMAPTEVLAEQHAISVRTLLDGVTKPNDADLFGESPIRVELFTGRLAAADRRRLAADLAAGLIDIAIGTHALITETLEFANLGIVVVDEQHRFGVDQRAVLKGKGKEPDVLVMTATPIPRTAALTVYGDLEVAILDELPPGRTPIRTKWAKTQDNVDKMWSWVEGELVAGHQAYVVCPLIEPSKATGKPAAETETGDELFASLEPKAPLPNVAETLEELKLDRFPHRNVAALHGRMSSIEKEEIMNEFRAGKIDVLVATTVIEVGVDVGNASVMVILGADRFGISQLHQLRGRVGRGAAKSWCFLVTEQSVTVDAEARLGALVKSTDGFELAQTDLELRGEGALFGTRQTGMNDLKLASLARDLPLIEASQKAAHSMLDVLAKKSKKTEDLRKAVTDEQRILERSVAETNRVFDS